MKILVVESSIAVGERLLALLARSGKYTALGCAASAAQALEMIAVERPDALLLDLYLNDGSGFKLLEVLRTWQLPLPVIVLSINHGWQYQIQAKALGAAAFLCKSTQFEDIVPTLDRLLHADAAGLEACGAT